MSHTSGNDHKELSLLIHWQEDRQDGQGGRAVERLIHVMHHRRDDARSSFRRSRSFVPAAINTPPRLPRTRPPPRAASPGGFMGGVGTTPEPLRSNQITQEKWVDYPDTKVF